MYLFIVGLLVVLVTAWVWGTRGFLSALIHMVCVVIGGAVALGLWETAAYAILDGAKSSWMVDVAWGAALAIPFAVTVALLRVGIDKAIPFNTDLDGASNMVGGMFCGGVAGFITAGIFTLTITNCRINTSNFDFKMVDYNTNGSIIRADSYQTLIPRYTVALYSFMSEHSLKTGTPMAEWRPDLAYEGSMLGMNFNEGTSRMAVKPSAFSFVKRYTIGEKATDLSVKSFLAEGQSVSRFGEESSISAADKGYYIEGFVIKFLSAARESDGRVVVGNSQVQLVARSPDDTESKTFFPIAAISQADVGEGDVRVRYWRWAYAAPRTYIASVGGADDPPMAFEFLVPKGWKPLSLNVKGVRFELSGAAPGMDYANSEARTDALKRYEVVALPPGAKGASSARDWPSGDPLRATAYVFDGKNAENGDGGIRVSDVLPYGIMLSVDNKGSLTTGEGNRIIEGESGFRNADLDKMKRMVDAKLQVRRIDTDEKTMIVQVDISNNSPLAYTKNKLAITGVGAPVLVDTLGQRYSAIGYVYKDATNTWIRLQPGSTVGSVADLPDGGPSASRNDQGFTLLYRVTTNVKLKSFDIGTNTIVKIEPNVEIKKF